LGKAGESGYIIGSAEMRFFSFLNSIGGIYGKTGNQDYIWEHGSNSHVGENFD
jgi:hypothetical protein